MRKIRNAMIALALVATAGSVAQAQQTDARERPRAERSDSGRRGMGDARMARRGPRMQGVRAALRGVQPSETQRTQIRAIHEKYRTQYQELRKSMQPALDEARAARQRDDSAAARAAFAKTEVQRQQLERLVAQERSEIRALLTPEQQKRFDANLARLEEKRGGRGKRGPARG